LNINKIVKLIKYWSKKLNTCFSLDWKLANAELRRQHHHLHLNVEEDEKPPTKKNAHVPIAEDDVRLDQSTFEL